MNIIPFSSGKVPAAITAMFGDSGKELLGNAASGGFPVVSIKGKVFHIQRGDERVLITKPGEDDPAASIEVVIVRANPNKSKVFYADGYQEGEKSKPTCYSNSGIAPEADAQEPQAKKCAVCPHAQWGARITSDGRKAKACSDSRRIAIATLDTPNDPMLVRVPAASMKALEEFAKILAARGVPPESVVTKIGFDYSVAHPALTFKPVGLIGDADVLAEIKQSRESEIVAKIVGLLPVDTDQYQVTEAADEPVKAIAAAQAPAPAPTKPKAQTKPTKSAEESVDAAVAAAAGTKKVAVRVEEEPPAPAPAAKVADDMASDVADMLDGLDFDN